MFRGDHAIKSWSSNQTVIALSSAEAELYALLKGASQVLGLMSMGNDLGDNLSAGLWSDASAAIAAVKIGHLLQQLLGPEYEQVWALSAHRHRSESTKCSCFGVSSARRFLANIVIMLAKLCSKRNVMKLC